MKLRAAVVPALLFASAAVMAENRLFPTDVLEKGRVDVFAGMDNSFVKLDGMSFGNPGRFSHHVISEAVAARYGGGNGWHVGLSLPYFSKDVSLSRYRAPPAHFKNEHDGAANPEIFARYSFLGEGISRLSLAGDITVSPHSLGDTASAYSGRITAGWRSDETLRLYAGLQVTARSGSAESDSNSIFIGAHKIVAEGVTLIPRASYYNVLANDYYTSQSYFTFGLGAHIRVAPRTYVVPGADLFRYSSNHRKDGALYLDSSEWGRRISVSIYHLF